MVCMYLDTRFWRYNQISTVYTYFTQWNAIKSLNFQLICCHVKNWTKCRRSKFVVHLYASAAEGAKMVSAPVLYSIVVSAWFVSLPTKYEYAFLFMRNIHFYLEASIFRLIFITSKVFGWLLHGKDLQKIGYFCFCLATPSITVYVIRTVSSYCMFVTLQSQMHTVHLISAQDQPGLKKMHNLIWEAKSSLS